MLASTPRDRCSGWSPTVLVIDDHAGARESVAAVLEAYGFQVVIARDGEQGMLAFRKAVPDAVITDIIMPEKDGLEVIREIRRERSDVGIVAITGGARMNNSDLSRMAVELGADAGLLKPFDPMDLVAVLRTVLQHRRETALTPVSA